MTNNLRRLLSALLFVLPLSLHAQTPWSITPNSGPTSGGQEVVVKGSFGAWPYGLIFGSVSVPATRVDDTTLRAVTPPHPAGTVDVVVFEGDIGISTDLEYTFVDDGQPAFERVLLPILLPPVEGRNESEFRTDFRVHNRSETPILLYGLLGDCGATPCSGEDDRGLYVAPRFEFGDDEAKIFMSGSPGAFIYVPRAESNEISMHLRAYDVSREATNYGTEIPVVREDEMRSDPLVLLGVPTDPRFRNLLRVYSTEEVAVLVEFEHQDGSRFQQSLTLAPGTTRFDPAYTAFSGFPVGVGPVRVTITPLVPIVTPPVNTPPPIWGFVTVTNNDTQHITVISPQR